MRVKSKKLSNSNFYCDKGINMDNISQWFKEEMVFTSVSDGVYYGKTGLVELKEGKAGLRLIVNVSLKDNEDLNVLVEYSTQFTPQNYFLKKLFKDFSVDLDAYPLNLESLADVYVEATVKNNGPYCNVVDMVPLDEAQIEEFISQHQNDDLDLELDEPEDNSLDDDLEDFKFEDEEELD